MNSQNKLKISEIISLMQKLKSGNVPNADDVIANISKNLSSEQQAQIQNIMSDKTALKKLLNSKEAAELIKRLNQNK